MQFVTDVGILLPSLPPVPETGFSRPNVKFTAICVSMVKFSSYVTYLIELFSICQYVISGDDDHFIENEIAHEFRSIHAER